MLYKITFIDSLGKYRSLVSRFKNKDEVLQLVCVGITVIDLIEL